ncbi:MAG: prealbumin-like fold domain-containing protein [Chitinophagales bacterium]|nr:prealbumin-like fold domain-containing protein [Chitinophagales bacterium]
MIKAKILFAVLAVGLLLTACSKQETGSTTLVLTVSYNTKELVEGADVRIYKTFDEFKVHGKSSYGSQKTGADGQVTFTNLEPIEYYVYAEKDGSSNMGYANKAGPLTDKRKHIGKVTLIR